MKLYTDIKQINLARLMGVVSFGIVVYCLLTQKPIEYVNSAVYVMLIVWGATFGKNVINLKGFKK